MAEYTLIKIDALPDGTANLSSKVMFGIGDKIHTTTVSQMLSLFVENNSITPRQQFVNLLVTNTNFGTILNGVNVTIAQNEILFLQINALFNNRATFNTYLVPLGAGVYNPLGSFVPFASLILINEQPLEDLESDTNTITYTVTGLSEINTAVVPFDFSDETKVYFVTFGGNLYLFGGTPGLYGSGELQMTESDLELISTQGTGDFVQKVFFDYSKISLDVETLPADGRTNFTIDTALATFKGFNGSNELFRGKRFIIRNLSGADCELLAGQAVDLPFADTIILEDGKNIEFDVFNNELKRVGSEGGGVTIHNDLTGRDASDAHPIEAITGLELALGNKVDKDIIPYTAIADFNPLPAWRGQVVEIDLGGVNRTMTISESAFFAIIIKGSGVLTVLSGVGRTLVEQNNSNQITENATTALIFSIGTTDYLSIKDLAIIDPQDYALNEFNNPTVNKFLRFNNILPQRGTVVGDSVATTFAVTLPEPYIDSDYDIDLTLVNNDNRVWLTLISDMGFTINTANVMTPSQSVKWKTKKIS